MCMPIIILAVRAWRETPLHATPINCRSLSHTAQQTKTLNERRFNLFALRMAKIVNKFAVLSARGLRWKRTKPNFSVLVKQYIIKNLRTL